MIINLKRLTSTLTPYSAIRPSTRRHTVFLSQRISVTARKPLQLFIAQLESLLGLISEPIRFAHIKPSFLGDRHSFIKFGSTIEFLQKLRILLELGKQGGELVF